jgi:hypothetical protein
MDVADDKHDVRGGWNTINQTGFFAASANSIIKEREGTPA